MSELCFVGLGKPPNPTEAAKWLRKAADQGHVRAQSKMGTCYSTGDGVPKDLDAALKCYRQAALQGFVVAQSNLGVYYETGTATAVDLIEAMKWYLIASAQGDQPSADAAKALAPQLTPEQRAEAQSRADEFQKERQ